MTEKDLAPHVRKWLKEHQKQAADRSIPRKRTSLPAAGGKGKSYSSGRVQPGTVGKPNDLSGGSRALPPPGYQDANEAFKRMLNKSEPGGP